MKERCIMRGSGKVKGNTREEIRNMVDALPVEELPVVRRFIQYLRDMGSDPMLRALANAPVDDEPTTTEEEGGAKRARNDYRRGRAISADEAKRRILT